MKFAIVCAALIAVAIAAPAISSSSDQDTLVVKYQNDRSDEGDYSYTVELSDGTIRHEEGAMIDVGLESEHMEVKGYFIYKGPEGQLFRTDYQVGTEGFQAQGEHLPKNE